MKTNTPRIRFTAVAILPSSPFLASLSLSFFFSRFLLTYTCNRELETPISDNDLIKMREERRLQSAAEQRQNAERTENEINKKYMEENPEAKIFANIFISTLRGMIHNEPTARVYCVHYVPDKLQDLQYVRGSSNEVIVDAKMVHFITQCMKGDILVKAIKNIYHITITIEHPRNVYNRVQNTSCCTVLWSVEQCSKIF